jgi:hypothetical protein
MSDTLNPKEDLFCSNYTAIGEPTFSHKERSAVAAGYSEKCAGNAATALLRRPEIQRRLDELKAENRQRNNVSTDSVVENLTHDRDMARAKGDWAAAIRADELIGKTLGVFVDKQEITEPERRDLDAAEKAEASELARLRLASKYGLTERASPPRPVGVVI